ncbi:MAG: DUF6152 family protein [Gammaproteobacteria bacterium]|jgi:hypothetical protein
MTHDVNPRIALACIAILLGTHWMAGSVRAHHSTAEYDSEAIEESRGEVITVIWRNPHVRLRISTEAIDGDSRIWELEGVDLTRLDRYDLPRDLVSVGDVVSFAGNPSTRKERRMYVTNLWLADGREILLRGGATARWAPERVIDTYAPLASTQAASPAPADDGIFDKVYSPTRGPAPAWLRDPPLTEAARASRADYDAVLDDPVLGCVSPGMPRVMTRSGPYAIRFLERNGDIIQQNEWFEIDRVIHMDGAAPPSDYPYTPLGYSAGTWEGRTLVVTTTHIDWPYFQLYGLEGVPQSHEMVFVERFTPDENGTVLRYDIAATDPQTFTQTVAYDNYVTFRWDPGLDFLPYDCIEEERRARSAR